MRRLIDAPAQGEPRFLEGTPRELEELFGGQLPDLPGRERPREIGLLVDLAPGLRKDLRDLLGAIIRSLDSRPGGTEGPPAGSQHVYARFEETLEELLVTVVQRERRLGLLNLFWLAHSKDAAGLIQDVFSQPGIHAPLKYRMYPLLRGVYRNAVGRAWARVRSLPGHLMERQLGENFNPSLIDAILDDQLPFTEPSIASLNFAQLLTEDNKRFRLTFREFRELFAAGRERLRDGLQRREPRLMDILRRTLPSVRPERYEEERVLPRLLFSGRLIPYLLAGLGETARRPAGRGAPRRGLGEVLSDYLDLAQAVKRSEVVDRLRQEVELVKQAGGEDARLAFDQGRLYRFHPGAEVVTLSRKITILFADLRGFTRASEGGVSERELTAELYQVFDPLAAIVAQHGGRIDKFTGDGVMVTFGFGGVTRDDELNALRTALAIQALMAGLRQSGRTHFAMGISVHTGRAQLAHFILNVRDMDRTVIGRNVNIAGRLSGSGKTQASAFDEGESPEMPPEAGGGEVRVNAEGTLYNTGVVVSQDTVEELLPLVESTPWRRETRHGVQFRDAELGRIVLLEYIGDARFKGVGRSIAIYRLGVEEEQPVAGRSSEEAR